MANMLDDLPITRGEDGQLNLAATGPVSLEIEYNCVLGTGGQGVVFGGKILEKRGNDTRLIMKVGEFVVCLFARLHRK